MGDFLFVKDKIFSLKVTIQPRSLRDTKKHKEREMRKITTVKNGGFYFILKQAQNALDNIKSNIEFLCEPSRHCVRRKANPPTRVIFVAKVYLSE